MALKGIRAFAVPLSLTIASSASGGGGDPQAPSSEQIKVAHELSASIIECSAGTSLKIDSNINGSVLSALSGESTIGRLSLSMDNFLLIFPESDRLEALRVYTECLSMKYVTDGANIEVPAIPEKNRFMFSSSDEKPRILMQGDLSNPGADTNYEILPAHDCTLVLIADERNNTAIKVDVQEIQGNQSTKIIEAEVYPQEEPYFIGGPNSNIMQNRNRYLVTISPLSRRDSGTFHVQFGRRC